MDILELTINTNDLNKTKSFYTSILELELLEHTENSISFRVGNSKLIFKLVDKQHFPKYHFTFNIPNNQLKEAIAWTEKKVPLMEIEGGYIADFEDWKAQSIYFYDNNQNILEFIAREDLKNESNKPFGSNNILDISEVGVVTESPIELGNLIIEKTKTVFFVKGPKREDFAAVGDEQGLFVISNNRRNWYPTNDKAEKHPVKAKVKVEGVEVELEFNETRVV